VWIIVDDERARLRVAALLKSIDHDLMAAVHLVTAPPRHLPATLLPMPTRHLKKRRTRRSKALRTGGK
jgi:hypothetical protein